MKLAVPNAILFVLDPSNKKLAIPEYENLVSHTDSCVSVGTQADVDGETEVTLDSVVSEGLSCAFEGEVQTPGCSIAVETSGGTSLERLDGLTQCTRISIWVDDMKWPSRISVVVNA